MIPPLRSLKVNFYVSISPEGFGVCLAKQPHRKAKALAHIVLLDSDFSTLVLPRLVDL